MSDSIAIYVARYRPGEDDAPTEQRYDVPLSADLSVLEALNYIKDELDPTLSYRWSCRMAICGSCGVMIDGEPRLGCKTFLREFAGRGELHLRALDHFPVERDLVVDQLDQPDLHNQPNAQPDQFVYCQLPHKDHSPHGEL